VGWGGGGGARGPPPVLARLDAVVKRAGSKPDDLEAVAVNCSGNLGTPAAPSLPVGCLRPTAIRSRIVATVGSLGAGLSANDADQLDWLASSGAPTRATDELYPSARRGIGASGISSSGHNDRNPAPNFILKWLYFR